MILGVDFDNTLVCYDGLFHLAAVERGMMPPNSPRDKRGVRQWLVERGREDDFTVLQGHVYGPGLAAAKPYPGAFECLWRLKRAGAAVYVVSHKTKIPAMGPLHDLRQAARDWLEANGFHSPGLLARDEVFFEETIRDKAARVAALGCTHFIDDMAAFLLHPTFPAGTARLLFLPPSEGEEHGLPGEAAMETFTHWRELAARLGGG